MSGPQFITMNQHADPRGNLCVAESGRQVPFTVNRVFYIYGIPKGVTRGGHAHRQCHQFMIALAGRFDGHVRWPEGELKFTLDSPTTGCYLPPMSWVEFTPTEEGSICLVLTSDAYDPTDYVANLTEFEDLCRNMKV